MTVLSKRGHGEQLSNRQEAAIAALLTHGNLVEAAKACGVAHITLWRWLKIPSFAEQYRHARSEMLSGVINQLRCASRDAIESLQRNLTCGQAEVEIAAAKTILELALKPGDIEVSGNNQSPVKIEIIYAPRSINGAIDVTPHIVPQTVSEEGA